MSAPAGPSVVLAAGTSTGAGTTVALVEACRTLARQLDEGEVSAVEVRIPEGADEARSVAVGCTVVSQTRLQAVTSELIDRTTADVYIGFADRLPLNRRKGATRVMVVQNPHLYVSSEAPSLGEMARRARTLWAKRSATAADLIVCATSASQHDLEQAVPGLRPDRVVVRPIRPKTPAPRTEVSATIQRFVLLGDLYTYKRFDVAVDGIVEWARLQDLSSNVSIVHCGRERDEQGAASFAMAIERAERAGVDVVRRGSVTHDQAMDELLAADVLVSASEVETQGLTILEAMAVGVPVVARSIGPIEDVAGNAVQGFSVDGAASAVSQAIASIETVAIRQELIERGLVRADMATGWNLLP